MFLQIIKHFFSLTKALVAISVVFTSATAYILSGGKADITGIMMLAGVYLLASGASALNQVQEYRTDALMERTKHRPIPSGALKLHEANRISFILIISGTIILYLYTPVYCVILGLLNIAWYNLLYTPLKFKTAFAIIPGALSGVIPVFIGWIAGGGKIFDPEIILLGFFIYIWQIPHFWLLVVKYGKEYEQAGLSSLITVFNEQSIKKLIWVWATASIIAALFLPFFGIIKNPLIILLFSIFNIWFLLYFAFRSIREKTGITFKHAFMQINLMQLMVMVLIIIDKILGR